MQEETQEAETEAVEAEWGERVTLESGTAAGWAACRHDGWRAVGVFEEGAKDNYMAEMAAQLEVARAATGRRLLVVIDASTLLESLRSDG